MSFCSCIDENYDLDDTQTDNKLDYSGPRVTKYFSFRLDMADGVPYTRGESSYGGENNNAYTQDFEDGVDGESAINNILIIFYDESGKYLTHFDSQTLTSEDNTDETPNVEELKWKTTITVEVEVFESLSDADFDSFFAIVNYDKNIKDKFFTTDGETAISLDDLKDASIAANSYKTDNGFLMTTPVYYDNNGKFFYYQKLSEGTKKDGIIFNSKSQAEANPVTVYVERLAARIDIAGIGDITPIEVLYGTDVYTLTFTPTGWGLQAEEKSEYLPKHGSPSSEYTTAKSYPADFYNWLNFTDSPKRTFWAESPNFLTSNYVYAANGLELDETPGSSFFTKDLSLQYNLYSEIEKNKFKDDKYEGSIYTMEHTFPVSELSLAANPYAVPTSLVVTGQYSKAVYKGTDDIYNENATSGTTSHNDLNFNNKGFYLRHIDFERTANDTEKSEEDKSNALPGKRYQYRLYRENNEATTGPQNDLYIALLKEQHIIFTKTEQNYTYTDDKGEHTETITSYEPVKITTKYIKDGKEVSLADEIFEITNSHQRLYNGNWIAASNTYTLQLKSELPAGIQDLYYGVYTGKNPEAADYIKVTNGQMSNISDANKELQKQLGYAQFYYKGKAFFYSPVLHYKDPTHYSDDKNPYKGLFYTEKSTDSSSGVTKYEIKNLTGEFAVVRNNIYNFTIDGISNLGYGIPGDDYIPLPEPVEGQDIYYFDLELKILPWNVFEYTLDI